MTTLLTLLSERVLANPTRTALRHHRFGIWEPMTWQQLHDQAALVGAALMSKGVVAGDTVALIASNQPMWAAIDLGIMGCGAATLALDPNLNATDVVRIVDTTSCKIAIAGDQEQFDKLEDARLAGGLSALETVLVVDTRGVRHLDVAGHRDAEKTDGLSGILGQTSVAPSAWKQAAIGVAPSSVAVRFADGSAATHEALVAEGVAMKSKLNLSAADQLLSQMTFADRVERSISVSGAISSGLTVNVGEGGPLAALELSAVQPTIMHVSPQWLDAAATNLRSRMTATKGLKSAALGAGWKPKAVQTQMRTPGMSMLKKLGLLTLAIQFVFLLFSVHLHDGVRVLILIVIALLALIAAVVTGAAVTAPLRRLLGFARARAVISTGRSVAGEEMLGSLGVPLLLTGDT